VVCRRTRSEHRLEACAHSAAFSPLVFAIDTEPGKMPVCCTRKMPMFLPIAGGAELADDLESKSSDRTSCRFERRQSSGRPNRSTRRICSRRSGRSWELSCRSRSGGGCHRHARRIEREHERDFQTMTHMRSYRLSQRWRRAALATKRFTQWDSPRWRLCGPN
jgi:hypothetical protein